jgi:predicted enzyme related to lactoylglutathione lyase
LGTIHCITVDCAEPAKLSKFWGQALEGYSDDASGVIVRSESGSTMYFQQVPEGKSAKNRVHLELATHDREAQVRRLVLLGASVLGEFDQDARRWTVLADPEGNEFCIQSSTRESDRPRLVEIVFDSGRPTKTARFWEAALDGYAVRPYDDAEIARLAALGINDYLNDDPNVAVDSADGPGVFFQTVPEPKTVKNRVHIDIGVAEVQPEVERLTALGATTVRAMQEGGMVWTVMTDPEGNEFCVCLVVGG